MSLPVNPQLAQGVGDPAVLPAGESILECKADLQVSVGHPRGR